MNKLLPELNDLKPINDWWKTFSETPFTREFNELNFKDKLQIINDIVRQTMMYNETPNPKTHIQSLVGDSYTASLVAIEYLKYLNIGTNYRCVLARKKKYDPDDIKTKHVMVLVDDNLGNSYQFDCSPYVGYKCGKVEEVNNNRFYEEYYTIDGQVKEGIELIRQFVYDLKNSNISKNKILEFDSLLDDIKSYEILKGYISYCYYAMSKYSSDNDRKIDFYKKALINDKYSHLLLNKKEIDKSVENREKLLLKQVSIWKEELNDLIFYDKNFKRQLELSQNIVQELKNIYPEYEKYIIFNNSKISFSHISPRFFLENGLNVVLLKPSAFRLGVSATIKNSFLKRGNGIINESFINVGAPSEFTGIKPMRMFHPCGYIYERSMNGPGDMILIRDSAESIGKKKKQLRKELGKYIENQKVLWYDGEEIEWNSDILNLVHSTDDPSEASLHYLCAYPEYQLMTRFMYPNPILGQYERRLKR